MSAGSIVGEGDRNHGVAVGVGTGVAVCCSKISSRLADASGWNAMPGTVGVAPRGPRNTATVPPAKIAQQGTARPRRGIPGPSPTDARRLSCSLINDAAPCPLESRTTLSASVAKGMCPTG